MTGTPPPSAPRRAPRWMKIVLVVSVALNLLIAAMVVGAVFARDRDGFDHSDRAMMRDLGRTPFVSALDFSDRRALGRSLRDGPRPDRADLAARFEAVLGALRRDPFDRAALEAELATARTAASARQARIEAVLLDRLEGMSASERRAYADRLDRSLRRRD